MQYIILVLAYAQSLNHELLFAHRNNFGCSAQWLSSHHPSPAILKQLQCPIEELHSHFATVLVITQQICKLLGMSRFILPQQACVNLIIGPRQI